MRVWLCGVRGSTPATGADFSRIGGNTSCVAIAAGDDAPTLLLDGGTGLARVSSILGTAPFRGTMLLGHLHWDHMMGLPFFPAGDREDAQVRVFVPAGQGRAVDLLGKAMSPPNFPIAPRDLRGGWTFGELDEGTHEVEEFAVLAREIPHKGGRTFGFRVTAGGATLAYLSDHSPQSLGAGPGGVGAMHEAAVALARGADLLIHDAQYTTAELRVKGDYGHCAADYAAALGEHAGARQVLLFHHDPARSDAEVEQLTASVRRAHPDLLIDAAREDMVIDL